MSLIDLSMFCALFSGSSWRPNVVTYMEKECGKGKKAVRLCKGDVNWLGQCDSLVQVWTRGQSIRQNEIEWF
jgi:hypothetical protein